MVELSTPVKLWDFPRNSRLQSKGCRFNSCPFHLYFFIFFFIVEVLISPGNFSVLLLLGMTPSRI